MSQTSLWQANKHSNNFAELCNALYEREISTLANAEISTGQSVQGRLKSLVHYVNRTATHMVQVSEQGNSPLILDSQNATWSAKQANKLPLAEQTEQEISAWYLALIKKSDSSLLGLIVPVLENGHIILDCVDKVDNEQQRLRTNVSGWFSLTNSNEEQADLHQHPKSLQLLKPNKKVMLAACAGHCWQTNSTGEKSTKLRPIMPNLRGLLISCTINWKNFKQPLVL